MGDSINHGTVNTQALAEYFIKRYNLVGRDAEYTKNRHTLAALSGSRDTESLKKSDGFYETLKVAGGFTGSPDWVEGNKNHKPSKKVRWHVEDPYPQYGFVAYDALFLERNQGGASLYDAKKGEADDVRDGMLDTCEFELWNDGTGNRGQIATAGLGGTAAIRVITLEDESTVYNFPYGAILTGNDAADGTGTTRTDRYEVTDLDPQGGKLTLTRTSGTSDDLAADDYLFVAGSNGDYMPGIPTFVPAVAPSDTLLGVARGSNPATSGWRFSFKMSIGETIGLSFSKMGRWVHKEKGKFVVALSTGDWYQLSLEREGRTQPDPSAMQKWGLEGLQVRTSYGPITCVAFPQMPDGRGYILDFSTWKFYSLKNLPHVIDGDGQTFVRGGVDTPDGYKNGDFYKMQFRMWKHLLCLKPMSNATFPTVAS